MKKEINLPFTILVLCAAAVIFNIQFKQVYAGKAGQEDIIQRMFGSLRTYVGDWAFIKAEEYHHRGLPFEKALAYHEGESMMSHEHENHEGAHAHDHAEPVASTIYSKLYNEVKVTKDSHLKPEEEKEVLPWFYVETAFNPHDIRGYVMGAYWLERMGKNEESLKFLRDGEKNNPDSAQIYSALGEYYFKMKNYDEAIKYLEKSCALWTEGRGVNAALDQYSQSDRLFAFDLSASLYMHNKDYAKAIRVYNEALKFGPNPAILEKLKKARSAAKGLNDNN